jgi:hypothetical protein
MDALNTQILRYQERGMRLRDFLRCFKFKS